MKGYQYVEPMTKKISISSDVTFLEDKMLKKLPNHSPSTPTTGYGWIGNPVQRIIFNSEKVFHGFEDEVWQIELEFPAHEEEESSW